MLKRIRFWAVMGLLFAGAASTASADTVIAKLVDQPLSRGLNVSIDDGTSYRFAKAGAMHWNRIGGDYAEGSTGGFTAFCIELTQRVSTSTYTFTVADLEQAPLPGGSGVGAGMQSEKADFIRELWGRHYSEVVDEDTSAAFQLAIWEIIYDDGVALLDGSFIVQPKSTQPAFVTLAQSWLDSLNGEGPRAHLMALSHPTAQDQVFLAPVPAAAWGGLALLLPLMARKIRRTLGMA